MSLTRCLVNMILFFPTIYIQHLSLRNMATTFYKSIKTDNKYTIAANLIGAQQFLFLKGR